MLYEALVCCEPVNRCMIPDFSECLSVMFVQRYGYSPHLILPHGSYMLNCGSSDPKVLHESQESLVDDLRRCLTLGLPHFNFHPGICTLIRLLSRHFEWFVFIFWLNLSILAQIIRV